MATLLLVAGAPAGAQGAQALARIESAAALPTCTDAQAIRFDERASSLWRLSARDLFRARAELAALDAALDGQPDGSRPVAVVRRGSGAKESIALAEVERELARARLSVDSVFRRLVRSRPGDDAVVVIDADISANDLRQLSVRANELIGVVTSDLFGPNRQPPGWMGVSISGEYLPRYTREGPAQLYCSQPVIESVEVGGPADKAGLQRGDTLLLVNGQPMQGREVRFGPLLQPGATITFRVRRSGRTRDVPVQVERRPASALASAALRSTGPSFSIADSATFQFSIGADGPSGVPRGMLFQMGPDRPPTPPVWIAGGRPGTGTITSTAFLGGARFTTLSRDFADALGVAGGVLVADVGDGSPAAEAGLREGDVVRLLNGAAVTTPLQISQAARQSRALTFEVVRRGKAKTIEFKW